MENDLINFYKIYTNFIFTPLKYKDKSKVFQYFGDIRQNSATTDAFLWRWRTT